MSINVTVKGNPVSIKRGKMITTSTDAPFNHDDGELKKRRQMRIQQVRQQSKDIAQNVRNKVKKEKTKQLDGVEEQNSAKLKLWQARKLVELQNQYRECLKDIGMGHNLAMEEVAEEEYLLDEQEHNQRKAAQRGFKAAQILQVDKNERTMKSALPVQQKKISRDIENVRASLITNINKTKLSPEKKKRKISADISVSKEINSSDDDSDDIAIDLIESSESSEIEDPVKSKSRRKSPVPPKENNKLSAKHEYREVSPNKRVYSKQNESGDSNIKSKLHRKNFEISPTISKDSIPDSLPTNTNTRNSQFMPFDTRISDRIKSRYISSEDTDLFTSTSADLVSKKSLPREPCDIRNVKTQTTENIPYIQSVDIQSTRNGFAFDKELKYVDVPKRPTIGIVNSKDSLTHLHSMPDQSQKFTRVQCYDRKNLFNSEMIMDNTNVQRIQEESLDVMPSSSHDEPVYSKTIFKRDRDAEIRGRKAMEKEKVHRDYQELMEKLPVLQKQERIASISKDKPIYHMDKDRFTEHETKRQNKMENTYEQLFPNVITIAPKNRPDTDSNKLPFRTIDNPDGELKAGTWDCSQTSDINQNSVNSKELQTLLRLLKKQKDTLEELGTLPAETSQQSLLDKLKDDQSVNYKRDKSKKSCKNYTKVLVLQNTSTQTTPKSDNDSRKSSPKRGSETKILPDDGLLSPKRYKTSQCHQNTSPVNFCTVTSKLESYGNNKKVSDSKNSKDVEVAKTKNGVKSVVASSEKKSCDCDENNAKDGKLCEIRISIQENETPIITVSSPKKNVDKVPLTSQKKEINVKSARKGILNAKPVLWREHLNENSSTSTSYNSPPNFHNNTEPENDITYQNESVQNNSTHNRSKKIDRRLMTYIKKLLELSQSQIEDLAVSSVSEVSTPSNSIINSATNNPVNQLMNVMKFFKLSSKDIAFNLNYSNDTPTKSSFSSNTRNESSSSNTTGPSDKSSENDSSSSTIKSTRVSQNLVTPEKSLNKKYAGVVVKYSEMADICHKRISDLTAKIEKVRHEKNQILESHSDSDKENSTTYFNLPSQLGQKLDETPQTTDSSGEQEKLTQMLLDVTRNNTDTNNSALFKGDIPEGIDDVDKDIVDRYFKLKFDNVAQSTPQSVQIQKTEENAILHLPFIPLMLDIPRLPKLSVTSIVSNSIKRPPPSKGLTAARKFNDDITAIPHELSTIAEADSAYSGKLTLKTADNSLQRNASPDYDTKFPPPVIILPESNPPTWTVVSDAKQNSLSSTEDSMPDLLAELISKVQVADDKRKNVSRKSDTDSSTEKSELESVENMLRNIGMGWAIATLRKTQETLGRTSTSSSSVDLSIHQELVTIDNSLRDSRTEEVVSKHFHLKSTSKSHSDSSSFCKELNDISAITGTSSSVENKDQRTSTPIQTTKSSDKSRNKDKLFTGESDLSSVQERDGHFLTLPDFTLTESHTKD